MSEDKKWVVYCHTSKTTGKKYVGITSNRPKKRWDCGRGYITQIKFYSDIEKYGWKDFTHEIIESGLTEQEAKDMEVDLISKLNLIENGYNVLEGGDNRKGIYPEYQKVLLKKRLTGGTNPRAIAVYFGKEKFGTKEELAKYLNTTPATLTKWLKGKGRIPQEVLDKGIGYSPERLLFSTHKDGIVVCEGNEFENIRKCALFYNITYSTMYQWLKGINPMPPEWKEKGLSLTSKWEKVGGNKRRVRCVTTNKIFESIKKASLFYNIASPCHIKEVCDGVRKSAGKSDDGTPLAWERC